MSDEHNRDKLFKRAESYIESGQIAKAIGEFLKLLLDNPDDEDLLNRLGDLYLQGDRQQEALDVFKRAAQKYKADGFHDKATDIYKKAFRISPDDMEAASHLLDMYKTSDMPEDAAQVHLKLAESFGKKGQIKRALYELSKTVELEPHNIRNKTKLADLYCEEGLKTQAMELYLHAAESYAADGNSAELERILQRAKRMDPAPKLFLFQYRLHTDQKDLNSAKNCLDEGLKANPKNEALLKAKAEVEFQLQHPLAALEALAEIPQLSGKDLLLCGRALEMCKAEGTIRRALEVFTKIAVEKARQGFGSSVKNTLRSVLGNQPNAEYWLLMAEIARNSGSRAEHIDSLKCALNLLTPEDPRADSIRKKLLDIGAAPDAPAIARQLPEPENDENVFPPFIIEPKEGDGGEPRLPATIPLDLELQSYPKDALPVIIDEGSTQSSPFGGVEPTDPFSKLLDFNAAPEYTDIQPHPKAQQPSPITQQLTDNTVNLDQGQLSQIQQLSEEARQLESASEFDKAARLYRKVIEIDPTNFNAIEQITEIHKSSGMLTKALAHLTQMAENLVAIEKRDLAIKCLDIMEELMPGSTRVHRLRLGLNFVPAPKPAEEPMPEPLPDIPTDGLAPLPDSATFEEERDVAGALAFEPIIDEGQLPPLTLEEFGGDKDTVSELMNDDLNKALLTTSFDAPNTPDAPIGEAQRHKDMHGGKEAELIESAYKIFGAFKEEIEDQIAADDYDTHYSLGIAYKEMLLLDPAIESFKKALGDHGRTLECYSMIAMCEEMRGDFYAAIEWLTKGVEHPHFAPISSIALRYDLALLLDRIGRHEEAHARHQQVLAMDPHYTDERV